MTNSIDNIANRKPLQPSQGQLEPEEEKIEALEQLDPNQDDPEQEMLLQEELEAKNIEQPKLDLLQTYLPWMSPAPQKALQEYPPTRAPVFALEPKCRGPADSAFLASAVPPKDFEQAAREAIFTPPSAPPKLSEPSIKPATPKLPQSDKFWEEVDLPENPVPENPSFEEALEQKNLLFPEFPRERSNVKNSEQDFFTVVNPQKPKEKTPQSTPPSPPVEQVRATGKSKGPTIEKEELQEEKFSLPLPLPPVFPPPVAAVVSQTQTISAPYLTPTAQALFQQMVGAIVYIQKEQPGVSRTEIVLNADNLRGSPFFEARVILERYSTAPDSFNIQLAGSPQAVKLFQNNLTGLASAFTTAYENKLVDFRIGRMETVLAAEWTSQGKKRSSSSEGESEDDDSDWEE